MKAREEVSPHNSTKGNFTPFEEKCLPIDTNRNQSYLLDAGVVCGGCAQVFHHEHRPLWLHPALHSQQRRRLRVRVPSVPVSAVLSVMNFPVVWRYSLVVCALSDSLGLFSAQGGRDSSFQKSNSDFGRSVVSVSLLWLLSMCAVSVPWYSRCQRPVSFPRFVYLFFLLCRKLPLVFLKSKAPLLL